MTPWIKLVSLITGSPAEQIGEYYREKQRLKHERELEKMRGKIAYEQAKTQRASESEGRDHEWEIESIRNSGWKDEWVLLLLSIPLIGVFIPSLQPAVLEGFDTLDKTPEWYQWLVLLIFTAIYGIRVWRRSFGESNGKA